MALPSTKQAVSQCSISSGGNTQTETPQALVLLHREALSLLATLLTTVRGSDQPPAKARGNQNLCLVLACMCCSGTGYPCHPYCLAVDEDEKLHCVALSTADENKSQFPLKQCLRYKRKKLALTLALLVRAAIGTAMLLHTGLR